MARTDGLTVSDQVLICQLLCCPFLDPFRYCLSPYYCLKKQLQLNARNGSSLVGEVHSARRNPKTHICIIPTVKYLWVFHSFVPAVISDVCRSFHCCLFIMFYTTQRSIWFLFIVCVLTGLRLLDRISRYARLPVEHIGTTGLLAWEIQRPHLLSRLSSQFRENFLSLADIRALCP